MEFSGPHLPNPPPFNRTPPDNSFFGGTKKHLVLTELEKLALTSEMWELTPNQKWKFLSLSVPRWRFKVDSVFSQCWLDYANTEHVGDL